MPKQKGMCIAVFAKHGASPKQAIWRSVVDLLAANAFSVLVCDSMLTRSTTRKSNVEDDHPNFEFANLEQIRKKAKIAVIIGGDGTFLGTARELADCNIPLIGINQGRLGFLTDIRLDDIDPTLIDTIKGQSVSEARAYLQGQILRQGKVVENHIALNDIVISRGIVGGMVELRVEVDGTFMYDLRADGLIVSTPTGSTAYALSADGPILHPSLAGLLIVPVAPHALTNRPIALPQHSTIDIFVTGGKQTGVHFDMQFNGRAKVGDQIRIKVSPHPIQLLHPARYDYFAMLRQKLHWSASPTEAPTKLEDSETAAMLNSLTIQDFVIVDKLDLHFTTGMSVLSGETGAGKSILIDALSLCLGARADASQVREGCERANITAVFEINPAAKAILDEQSIDCSEGEMHLRRAIESNGRSKAYINGTPVPASTLKELSETLIDIHGQHAFQTLAKPGEQLRLLDDFGQHGQLVQNISQAYSRLKSAEKVLKQAQSSQEERAARLENLQWKMDSLAKVLPKPGEWETLSSDFDRLSHGAELIEGTQHASEVLSQNENALLDQLTHVIEKLSHLSTRDPALEGVVKTLSEGEILIREASYDLGHYLKHSDLDPDTLAEVEARMSLWHETARKLRIQPETLHTEMESVQAEIKGLEEGFDVEKLHNELTAARQAYETQADLLTAARKKAAQALSKRVTESMQTLSMQGGVFLVDVAKSEPTAKGSDTIEFRVAGHPGVTPQAIQKVASGGELARISLAITVNTVESTPVPTLIFDEVDSGIGGAVAETVGRYLRLLAKNKQVLCVTHLPQVAAQGHNHFQVSKDISAQTTRSKIVQLETKARVEEIARMLGGQVITEATRTAAHEMIASASR